MVDAVKQILLGQFPTLSATYVNNLIERIKSNNTALLKYYLFVAEKKSKVIGVAIASHFEKEKFLFLDYIASSPDISSRGIGAALYTRVKEQSLLNDDIGVFLECDSVDRKFCISDEEQKQNKVRLNFYRRFGAKQLKDSLYEMPRDEKYSVHLLFDNNRDQAIEIKSLRKVVRSILSSRE